MKKILILLLSLALLLAVTGCGGSNEEGIAEKPQQQEVSVPEVVEQEEPETEYYFDGEVAETQDVKITIKRTKVIPVGEVGNEYGDKPVFAIWYDTTNKTGIETDPIDAWTDMFVAIQDNDENMINELNVGILPDESHSDSQMATIKEGGTIESSIAYEIDDLVTPVALIASNGYGGDELGREDYKID